eukprot:scaffold9774_cov19-Tisochrysis_lutea.AAC.1
MSPSGLSWATCYTSEAYEEAHTEAVTNELMKGLLKRHTLSEAASACPLLCPRPFNLAFLLARLCSKGNSSSIVPKAIQSCLTPCQAWLKANSSSAQQRCMSPHYNTSTLPHLSTAEACLLAGPQFIKNAIPLLTDDMVKTDDRTPPPVHADIHVHIKLTPKGDLVEQPADPFHSLLQYTPGQSSAFAPMLTQAIPFAALALVPAL